jgi:lipopolysaccharide export system protein LptC
MAPDRHSRVILWLKVGLPLIALGILSTLFLLSRSVDPGRSIPFADVEVQARLRDQQVTAPVFSGATAKGDEITFQADRLTTPAGTTGANMAQDVRLRLRLIEGTQLALVATQAEFDLGADRMALKGDVIISTSSGYDITTDLVSARISKVDITAPGGISARTPAGHLTAGAMRIHSPTDGSAQILFSNSVKLLYRPKQVKD